MALDSEAVKHACEAGTPAILVRQETVTSDIEGMAKAAGILTASGGRTSHAAVVARQFGKVCLVACPGLSIDLTRRQCRIGEATLDEGDFLSLDGNSGAVYAGRLEPAAERPERALAAIAAWRRAARLEPASAGAFFHIKRGREVFGAAAAIAASRRARSYGRRLNGLTKP